MHRSLVSAPLPHGPARFRHGAVWFMALALLATRPGSGGAQVVDTGIARPSAAAQPKSAPRSDAPSSEQVDRIARVRQDPNALPLPESDRFIAGAVTVGPGVMRQGPLAVVGGSVDVYGTVAGDVLVVDGDVLVHEGGTITGHAFAALGAVRNDGGTIGGEQRALQGAVGPVAAANARAAAPRTPAEATARALQLAASTLGVLLALGLGVLVFAGRHLDGVAHSVERAYARAFWTGVLGQLGFLPLVLLVTLGLAITVIGILLIPFAIVALVLAAAGLATLGFLAVARVTGGALLRQRTRAGLTERGAELRALLLGLALYAALWLLAAALTWMPVGGAILRIVALAVTWAAMTVGLGAAILSRAGTRQVAAAPGRAAPEPESAIPLWQTPTPVAGVAAARRPATTPARELP